MDSGTVDSTLFLKPFDTLVDSSYFKIPLNIISKTLIYCLYFITCYLCVKLALILLRTLWRLKDDIYGFRSKIAPSADKVILITGGTSGIGLALAKYFYKKGFSIIVTRHSRAIPEELLDIQGHSSAVKIDIGKPKMFFIHLDVTSQESIRRSHDEVREILSKDNLNLYALINNAGIAHYNKAIWMTGEEITALNSTNFLGPILMIRQYIPLLIKTLNSRIIQVGSGLSFFPIEYAAVYVGTKSGMTLYMNSLALELKPYNVKTVVVHVGDLIQNTSVFAHVGNNSKKIYEDLTADEREIYGQELEKHAEKLDSINNWIHGSGKGLKNNPNIFERIVVRLTKLLGGEVKLSVNIEDSYTMKSFDNAVCFRIPDKELFAGSWFYTLSGSFLSTLDDVERRAFGYFVHLFGISDNLVSSYN